MKLMSKNSDEFNQLINKAVSKWESPELENINLLDACPVLWFGNIDKASDFVMTVGINPSDKEFLDKRNGKLLSGDKRRFDYKDFKPQTLFDAYNIYFDKNPYTMWFGKKDDAQKGLEAALHYLNASYYDDYTYKYKAVHFDWFPFPTSKKFHDIKKSISFNLVEGTINELGKLIIDKAIDVLKPRFILSVGLDSWNYFTKYANPRKFLTSIVTVGSKDYKSMSLIYSTGNTKVCVYGSDLYYPNPNTPESCSFKDWLPLFEEFEKNRLYFSCHPMAK